MKNVLRIGCLFVLTTTLGFLTAARANPVNVFTVNDSIQDDWTIGGWWEELGVGFPANELISSELVTWGGHIPCPVSSGLWAAQVRITNLTLVNWDQVYYVADPETTFNNWDEMVGQVGNSTLGLAFRIDNLGENTPLVYESILVDNIFQAGEVWEFVIQEYVNSAGGPASALDSLGIAGVSSGWPPSTGSIIVVPEPAVLGLLALGGLVLLWRRRS
jgi:hypothetical protein